MEADSLIDSGDVVKDVLDDEECQAALRKGLKEFLIGSPTEFYKHFVMPRMPKFKGTSIAPEFTEMTPADMDILTSPEEYRKASDAIFAEINKSHTH